jgi:hypothetical protein
MNAVIDIRKLENVPPPVARYLRRALRDRQVTIEHAEFHQCGSLRTSTTGRWMPFTARHNVVLERTEFVWEARVKAFPFVRLDIRDSYAAGQGASQLKIFSALTLANQAGGEPVNSGSLHRYLAEAVWYPTALLPSEALTWTPINDTKALATLSNAGTTVSLEFWFSPSGAVSAIYTPGRWGSFPGGYRQVPWEGRFFDYRAHGGVIVPTYGEVGWHMNGTWNCVWTGRIDAARYDFSL